MHTTNLCKSTAGENNLISLLLYLGLQQLKRRVQFIEARYYMTREETFLLQTAIL